VNPKNIYLKNSTKMLKSQEKMNFYDFSLVGGISGFYVKPSMQSDENISAESIHSNFSSLCIEEIS